MTQRKLPPGPLLAGLSFLFVTLLAAAPVRALDLSASIGPSMTGAEHWSGVLYLDAAGRGRDFRGRTWQPVYSLGWIAARGETRAAFDRNVVVAAAGVRVTGAAKRVFLSLQLGLADRTTPAISSHGQFVSTLGWQGDRMVLMLRHISNADMMGGENQGETMVLVGRRF